MKMSRSYCAMIVYWWIACSLVTFSMGETRADILWQPPVTISSDLDVSTTGSLVRAWSVHNGSTTINGVTFSLAGGGNPLGDFTITGPGFGGTSTIFNNLSASYKLILDSAVYRTNGDTVMTINLNALTVGSVYEFQAFVNDSRDASGFGRNFGRSNVFDSGVGTSQSQRVFQPLNIGTTNIGQHIKGTFTATSNTQLVRMTGISNFGQDVSLINAYQLREISAVPEPSSILLISSVAGLGGMFLRKRRRGKK